MRKKTKKVEQELENEVIGHKVIQSEARLQATVVSYLSRRGDLLWCSIPNERPGGVQQLGRMIATGLRPGAPDLIIMKSGRILQVELKTAKGSQSKTQVVWESLSVANGTPYVLCRSLAEVEAAIANWLLNIKI